MTQKRILRANARSAARERDLLIRDAFRASWADPDSPETEKLLVGLAADDPDLTAHQLFGMVNRLIDEITEVTAETRDAVFARAQRD